jgi:hypothetical protein
MGERRGVCKVLLWKPEGNRLLGRPSRRWEGNIFRMWDGDMDWIDLAQNRDRWQVHVNAVMNFGVP